MTWWKQSLYDTCSLITLDKLLLERATMRRHFPKTIRALEKNFSADQLRKSTAKRMKPKVTLQPLPTNAELAAIFASVTLSTALAEVDKLVYATAVQFQLSVVTGDRRLGRALRDAGLQVIDIASILRDLVRAKKLTQSGCIRLLQGIARRKDLLLGIPSPTWKDVTNHTFPDR